MRTLLFVPADRPDRARKALLTTTEAVVVDLEDAVAPAGKVAARADLVQLLRSLVKPAPLVAVRVNAAASSYFQADLTALAEVLHTIDLVVLPMTEAAADVLALDAALTSIEQEEGSSIGRVAILPIVETSRGVLDAREIAQSADRVKTLMFGSADLGANLGVTVTPGGRELWHARSQVVLAAAAAGRSQPIDGPHLSLRDPAGLHESSRVARQLGFGGKGAIHPEQLPIIAQVFDVTNAELIWAREVDQAYRAAQDVGSGVATLGDGTFIDEPVMTRARKIIDIYEETAR